MPDPRLSVVMITRDRRESTLATLRELAQLPEQPRVVVVDNGSTDGTVDAVGREFPGVTVVAIEENLGSAGRTVGVRRATTPYVAFSDDDSWWDPGALSRAADVLDAHPRLAVVAGRVLVGPHRRDDPVNALMSDSPLPTPADAAGPPVLGFVACGAVVRREAYLEVGGFHRRYGVGGEERLLAADLASRGWSLAYRHDVVAVHHPSPVRDVRARRARERRNDLWSAWLRRRPGAALRTTAAVVASATTDSAARDGLVDAVRGLPWVLRERRPVPSEVEHAFALLDRQAG